MRNKWLVVLMVLVAAFAVGMVYAQDDLDSITLPTGDEEPITITYWHEWDGEQQVGIDAVIDLFEASTEYNIVIEQVSQGSTGPLLESVSTGIMSGEYPNLVGGAFTNVAQGWYIDDILVTLDPYIESEMWGMSDDEMAMLNEQILNINRPLFSPFNGQLLAMPIGVSANVLSVNLDFIDQLNEMGVIDFTGAPTTFEQFEAVACGASELMSPDGETPVNGFPMRGASSELMSFIYNNGGTVFNEETGMYDFTNDEAIEAMLFLQDLYNNGCAYFPEGGTFSNTGEFSLGLNPFAIGSSVGVPFIQAPMDEEGLDYNWVNVTPPYAEGHQGVVSFLRSVAILEKTPEENLATWLFVKFWATNPEAQVAWIEAAQYQPFNMETAGNLSEEFLTTNTQFTSFSDALADPEIGLYSPPAHPRAGEVDDVMEELYSNITIGGMDVIEAATEAEEEANEIYEEMLEDLEG